MDQSDDYPLYPFDNELNEDEELNLFSYDDESLSLDDSSLPSLYSDEQLSDFSDTESDSYDDDDDDILNPNEIINPLFWGKILSPSFADLPFLNSNTSNVDVAAYHKWKKEGDQIKKLKIIEYLNDGAQFYPAKNPAVRHLLFEGLVYGSCLNSKLPFSNNYKEEHMQCKSRHYTLFKDREIACWYNDDLDFPLPYVDSVSRRLLIDSRGVYLIFKSRFIDFFPVRKNSYLGQILMHEFCFSRVPIINSHVTKCYKCNQEKKMFIDITALQNNGDIRITEDLRLYFYTPNWAINQPLSYFLETFKKQTTCRCLQVFEEQIETCQRHLNTLKTFESEFKEKCYCPRCHPLSLKEISIKSINDNNLDISILPNILQKEIEAKQTMDYY